MIAVVKVLHILHTIERSGFELQLVGAAALFAAAGVETHVLSTGHTEGRLAGRFRDLGFTVHHLPFSASTSYLWRVRQLLRREHFDAVDIHTEQAFFWYGLMARGAGVPRVVNHVHGYFDFDGALRLERIAQRSLARRLLGMTFITVGPSTAGNERRRFLNESVVINNWVDTDLFRPVPTGERRALRARLSLPESGPLLVSVGSCLPLKRHALVVESLPLVRRLVPDAHYVHVGHGSEEPAERALAARLGVAQCCHFLGGRDDVADILAACDVFLMPSLHEGLGIAALEALSCELAVVATDVPGLRDSVVNGQTGVLVDPSPESLAAAVVCLLSDEELRVRLSTQGRRMVLEEHSPARNVADLIALYRG